MHRIDHETAVNGLFTEGNQLDNVPATRITDDWMNAVQEEIVAVILAAGLALNKANNGQLLAAIQVLATQAVVADYERTSDTVIGAASTVRLDLSSEVADTNDAVVTGASWLWTCKKAGWYWVNFRGRLSSWTAGATLFYIDPVINNNSQWAAGNHIRALNMMSGLTTNSVYFRDQLYLHFDLDDEMYFNAYNGAGSPFTLSHAKAQIVFDKV